MHGVRFFVISEQILAFDGLKYEHATIIHFIQFLICQIKDLFNGWVGVKKICIITKHCGIWNIWNVAKTKSNKDKKINPSGTTQIISIKPDLMS